ncbi:hypothetical protein JG687_00009262 [Phytophthora cactorum]|uniref:Uncharacterized protein n=1 Tax=Phytophthora cactorum TaxID=29920 RepID=A0A8T1UBR0_9STRA|nr:hypothetical protein JG687_00009262 [Phytophthora cactorum]
MTHPRAAAFATNKPESCRRVKLCGARNDNIACVCWDILRRKIVGIRAVPWWKMFQMSWTNMRSHSHPEA